MLSKDIAEAIPFLPSPAPDLIHFILGGGIKKIMCSSHGWNLSSLNRDSGMRFHKSGQ